MNKKNEQYLFRKYKKIFPGGRKVDPKMSLMCFGIMCDDGWFELIDKLCDSIQSYITLNPQLKLKTVVVEVKEKFGGLRFYTEGADEHINGMTSLAEDMSYKICEECGKKGKERGTSWVWTLCDDCWKKKKEERHIR